MEDYIPGGNTFMQRKKLEGRKKTAVMAAVFLAVNILAVCLIGRGEIRAIDGNLAEHAGDTGTAFHEIMENYKHSFRLFAEMMTQEIGNHPEPDSIWDYLKSMDSKMLEIEGDTFDGLYMYYKGRYLYSWDTPYSQYEETGYVATERPWYKAAVEGKGEIVFTPPYMSYANHYILTTISQLQPDGETVFAYDIKMGDIQNLVSGLDRYEKEQVMIFDGSGTVIGSTEEKYLGGSLYASLDETADSVEAAKKRWRMPHPVPRRNWQRPKIRRKQQRHSMLSGRIWGTGWRSFLIKRRDGPSEPERQVTVRIPAQGAGF